MRAALLRRRRRGGAARIPPTIVSADIEGGVVTILTSRDCSLSYLAATSAPSTAQDVVDNGTTVLVTGAEAEIEDIDDGLDPDDYTLYLVAHDSGSNLSAINSDVEFTVAASDPPTFATTAQQGGYSAGNVTVNLPTNDVGELLVVPIYTQNGPVSATGWTIQGTGDYCVATKVSTGSESNVVFSRGGAGNWVGAACIAAGTHSAYRVSSITLTNPNGSPQSPPAQTVAAGGMTVGFWWSRSVLTDTASSHTLDLDEDYINIIAVEGEAGPNATTKTVTMNSGGLDLAMAHVGVDP